MPLSDLLPRAFWPLALVHGLALLSPGPDFVLILSHAARRRLAGSVGICLGLAAGHALYVALAIAGLGGMDAAPALRRVLELAGAAYLLWLGVRLLRSTGSEEPAGVAAQPAAFPAQLALGFGTAALNPKNMVFYLAVMTTLMAHDAVLPQRIAAGVWMVGVVLGWDLLVAAVIALPGVQRALWPRVATVERVCGVVLAGMAVWMAVSP